MDGSVAAHLLLSLNKWSCIFDVIWGRFYDLIWNNIFNPSFIYKNIFPFGSNECGEVVTDYILQQQQIPKKKLVYHFHVALVFTIVFHCWQQLRWSDDSKYLSKSPWNIKDYRNVRLVLSYCQAPDRNIRSSGWWNTTAIQ